ncbi:MAG: aminopeptidase P family N-terminal domain-containing protein, partial [Kiloniellaceae bacterium]
MDSRARLAALRAEVAGRGLDGFIIPRADEHLGEYVPPRAQRLAWLTGFTGSSGIAVVLPEAAAIFVDGRYTLQVREEVDETLFTPRHLTEEPPEAWIEKHLNAGQTLGFDPWLHSENQVSSLRAAAEQAAGELVAVDGNPLDAVWPDQPAPPSAPVAPHPLDYAGRPSSEKRDELAR